MVRTAVTLALFNFLWWMNSSYAAPGQGIPEMISDLLTSVVGG